MTVVPASIAGLMTSSTSWRRAALKSSASASGSLGCSLPRSRSRSRSRSPEGRAARFAGSDDRDAVGAEMRFEARGQRGLAGALGPFDRDEPAATGRRRGACHAAECSGRTTARPLEPPPRRRIIHRRARPRTLGVMGRRLAPGRSRLPWSALAIPASRSSPTRSATSRSTTTPGSRCARRGPSLDVVIDMAEIPTFQERQRDRHRRRRRRDRRGGRRRPRTRVRRQRRLAAADGRRRRGRR